MPSISSRAFSEATRASISSVVLMNSGGVMSSLKRPEFGARLYFAADVNLRRLHLADQHGGEAGTNSLPSKRGHFGGYLCLDLIRYLGPIENARGCHLEITRESSCPE